MDIVLKFIFYSSDVFISIRRSPIFRSIYRCNIHIFFLFLVLVDWSKNNKKNHPTSVKHNAGAILPSDSCGCS